MSKRPPGVLILDDDDVIRESFVDYFEDRGWNVVSAGTAEAALKLVAALHPEGAVVDIRLPGMNGNAFMRAASRTHPRMAFVICTGSPQYAPPLDVGSSPQVAGHVYAKPVHDLAKLEETLRRQIKICQERTSSDE